MEIHHATHYGCVIATFTGSIDLFSASAVQRTLFKDLAEQPYGLICDLSGVDHLDPVCATVFATVVNHPASRWPTTGVALCGAQPQVANLLSRLRVPDFLPMYGTVDEALDAVVARPPYLRDELLLAPTPTAPAAARTFVRQVCRYWELALPDATVMERAVLLANELVTNAVVHAHTELQLRLELRGDRLHIAVRDGSPRLLRLVTAPDPEAQGGRGLWLVEQLAAGWGVNRHPDGGKVVWCVLNL
jgi:anti-sigma regulatory factor (Ser/Thr protein kinase)/anti-anti-sigma regulatory factor